MTSYLETPAQKQIWKIIQDINDTWVKGNPDNLANFFHKDMVIVSPDFQKRGKGREACVESYKDFTSQATVLEFKQTDPGIEVYGKTAIASYIFEITYEMKGETLHETGRDLFVFIQIEDRWRAVWRTIIPITKKQG